MEKDLIIIGGGSAGLAAAISAYDAGVKDILLIERSYELGGILNQCIHNGFGLHRFKEELTGPEYASRFIKEFNDRHIEALTDTLVTNINEQLEVEFMNSTMGYNIIKAKAIILAMGCNERTRGQISIPGERPKGVFTAGLAQKHLNIDGYLVGKNVYILGSGDIGLIMARRMSLEGANVIGVSELMPYSNGLNRNIVQCLQDFNIPLRLHNTVTKIIGKPNLEAIEICDVDDNLVPIKETAKIIKCDTLLLSVGLYPSNSLYTNANGKEYNRTKGAFIDQNLETSIPGIFSCGNVLHVHDLVDFVSMEGEVAGKNAAKLILEGRKEITNTIIVKENNNVGYVLPNIINVNNELTNVEFSFRVRKPIKKGTIIIKNNGIEIKRQPAVDLLPSEMKKYVLKDVDFNSLSELSVEVEISQVEENK